MTEKIAVHNLYKVFGDSPEEAVRLLREGLTKDEVFERTGQSVGVDDASFTIDEGEIFVIMGLSGSGKSTVVRLLNRLIEPTAGQVFYEGKDIAALSEKQLIDLRRRDLSMVFQSFALMPHMNVLDNCAFGLELSGVKARERQRRALEALAQVGLEHYAHSYPDELSGGMQQRVGLARALANDPPVMLMDEAFSALDPLIRAEMQDELLQLQRERKRTVVFISHDLDEAMRIGDRIAIMESGRVIQVGTPKDVLNNPADEYVHSFFRGVNVSTVLTAVDIADAEEPTVIERPEAEPRAVLEELHGKNHRFAYVVGPGGRYRGVVSEESLAGAVERGAQALSAAFLKDVEPMAGNTSVAHLIGVAAKAPCALPVVDQGGRYLGVVTKTALLETLDRDREEEHG